jgi:hypothetical protein
LPNARPAARDGRADYKIRRAETGAPARHGKRRAADGRVAKTKSRPANWRVPFGRAGGRLGNCQSGAERRARTLSWRGARSLDDLQCLLVSTPEYGGG